MKTKNLISGIAISIIFLLALTSCETDQTALLSDGAWTFENLTTDSEDETIQSFMALGKILLTDAKLEFQSDGNYLITSPLMEEPSTGTWSLIVEDQLIMNPEGDAASTGNIETLTKTKLSYTETYAEQDMDSYSITTTWVRD